MSKPVRILFLDNSFTFGGAINSLSNLLKALDKNKFDTVLVSGQPHDYLSKHFNCKWYRYIPKLPWVNDHIYRKIFALSLFRIKFFRVILHLLRFTYWFVFITIPETFKYYRLGYRHNVDLVHLNNIFGSQLAGILAARLLKVPCVAHLRDFEVVHPLTRFYARLIDHHVAISTAIRNNLLQLGVSEDRISLIHDAIDLTEFESETDISYLLDEFVQTVENLRFGIFGRVIDWKGIREFIHATSYVLQEIPDATAFIVGGCSDGEKSFKNEMIDLAKSLGIDDRVIFTGLRQDIPALMKFMDVIVHASNRPEPFGMVLIEAMAMAKPVVATRGGGPLDIVVDGETGLLVEMGNSKNLAKAICTLLLQPELRQKMGDAGYSRVKSRFNNQRYAAQMQTVFYKLLV